MDRKQKIFGTLLFLIGFAILGWAVDTYPQGNFNFFGDWGIFNVRDINTTQDVNVGRDLNVVGDTNVQSITALRYFGDGSGLTGVTALSDVNNTDVTLANLFVDNNANVDGDLNVLASISSPFFFGDGSGLVNVIAVADVNDTDVTLSNLFVDNNVVIQDTLKTTDLNATSITADYLFGGLDWTNLETYPAACGVGTYAITIGDTLTCTAADVNDTDIQLHNLFIDNNLDVIGDANFGGLEADFFYGDGFGITNVTVTSDVNNTDVTLANLFVDNNANIDGDLNVLSSIGVSSGLFGFLDWTFLQTYPVACGSGTYATTIGDTITCTAADVNDTDVQLHNLFIDNNLNVDGDSNFGGVEADFFYGDGSGLSNVTVTADVNQTDINPANVVIDNNLQVIGDTNLAEVQATNFFGGTYYGGWTFGSVLFVGADGNIYQNNSDLFWSDSNIRLTIGMNTGFDERKGLSVEGDLDVSHVSTQNDDHAVEIEVDAAGFGDVKGLDIDYNTGDVSAGEDEAVILVNIDETLATGGDIFGLEVLTTEGSMKVYGLKTGVIVGPVHQDSGTFANPTTGTDNTTAVDVPNMIDGSAGTTTAIFEADNEYILIGAAAAFEEIEFILTASASGSGIAPTFGYSTAGAHQFTPFSPVDGTDAFRNTGVVAWDASDLTSHAVNTDTGTFDIKITRTKNNLSTTPVLGFAKVASTTEYTWDKEGDIHIRDLNVERDLNVVRDANLWSVTAFRYFGDGSGLTNITSDVNDTDVQLYNLFVDNNVVIQDNLKVTDINATSITALYLFGGLDWTNLETYPVACGSGTYVSTIGDTPTCTAADVNNTDLTLYNLFVDNNANVVGDLNVGTAIASPFFFGDGSGLTNVSATPDVNNTDITLYNLFVDNNVVIQKNLKATDANLVSLGFTGLWGGTVFAGTWNGTAIVDAYVEDAITVNWTGLDTYPSACASGTYVTTVGDTLTCAAADVNDTDAQFYNLFIDNNLNVGGDSNFGGLEADFFYGDGTGITGITATSGWPPDTTIDTNGDAMDRLWTEVSSILPLEDANIYRYIPTELDIDNNAIAIDTNYMTDITDFNAQYCSIYDSNNASRLTYTVIADAPWITTSDVNNTDITLYNLFVDNNIVVQDTIKTTDLNATSITAAYLFGSLDWTNLETYPSACASGTYATTIGDTITCTAADINNTDVTLYNLFVDNNLNVVGDSNFGGVEADFFYGDGSGLTNLTAAADVNNTDVTLANLFVDNNAAVSGDLNVSGNTGVTQVFAITGLHSDVNISTTAICFPDPDACAMWIDYNGTALVFAGG